MATAAMATAAMATAAMATAAMVEAGDLQRERAFFFYMALAVVATVFAGFGFNFAMGMSSIHSPWWVHLHAASMMTWVALFVTQAFLVYRGNVTAHRALGPIAAGWSAWIVVLGFAVTAMDVRTHRVPPFFHPNYFLAMDWLNMTAFAVLVIAAVRLRNRSDWHKRLMLGAMINPLAVAWGRLTLPFIFDQRGIWLEIPILLAYIGICMLYDRRTRGSVHPAHFWSGGALVSWVSLSFATANLPPVVALAQRLSG
ncbi:MAG: hypothetical protein KGM93_05055 [Sphingomonadales bacterium]|nr:hypothetical protein [Sphingomonadales bacterium]